jgi:Rrf2 family protein
MRFSKRCQYGIKAAVCLAQHHGRGYLQSRTIAESEELPGKFLESILLALRSANILESKVGAGGGYRLSREPGEIRVSDMVEALNGAAEEDGAAGGALTPGNASLAVVNHRIDKALDQAFGTLSLSDLLSMAESRSDGAMNLKAHKA